MSSPWEQVHKALVVGTLIREACRDCGAEKVQAHHPDYSKPLDVIWLCRRCHVAEHVRLRAMNIDILGRTEAPTPLYVKLDQQERDELEAIRKKRGVKMTSEAIRIMIREVANRDKEGVTA